MKCFVPTLILPFLIAGFTSAAIMNDGNQAGVITKGLQNIRDAIRGLYVGTSDGVQADRENRTPIVSIEEVQQLLLNLTKSVNDTTGACNAITRLPSQQAKQASGYIDDTAMVIANGTTIIENNVPLYKKLNETDGDVVILRGVASSFDKLRNSCNRVFSDGNQKRFARMLNTIICDLNQATNALRPGTVILDTSCTTASKRVKHKHPHPHPQVKTSGAGSGKQKHPKGGAE